MHMATAGFLVFYRFKAMNEEETKRAKDEWNGLKNSLPSGIELLGEYVRACMGLPNIMVFLLVKLKLPIYF